MFCFVTAVILCAFYDLDTNVALFMSVFVIIVYFIIFKDKVNSLRAFVSNFFMGILKFKTIGEEVKKKNITPSSVNHRDDSTLTDSRSNLNGTEV